MSATVIIELTGDERRAMEAYRKTEEADRKLRDATVKTGDKAETAGRSFADAWIRAGKDATAGVDKLLGQLKRTGSEGQATAAAIEQHFRDTGTGGRRSMESIVASIRELDPAAAEVAERIRTELAQSDAQTSFERSLAELRKMNPEAAKAAMAVRDKMDEVDRQVKFDGIIAELRKLDPIAAAEAQKIGATMKAVPVQAETAFKRFSTSAIAQIGSLAGAYVGVQQSIQTVISLNQKVIDTNKKVFDSLKQTESGDKRLLQVSEGEADFSSLRNKADSLSKSYGIGRDEARGLMFSARSEGFEDTVDFIAANRQVIDIGAQAAVAGQVPTLFKAEGITGSQVIDATLAGAQASRLSFEQIGGALPSASEGAVLQGATASETIGALSVLASEFKSGDTAADRIKALATKMSLDLGNTEMGRESLAGVGLIQGVEMLMKMTDEQRRDFLGNSQEVNVAFSKFSTNLEEIRSRQDMISAAIASSGTAESPVRRAVQIAERDPMLAAQRRVAMSVNALEISREEKRAREEGTRQATINNALTEAEVQGHSQYSIALAEQAQAGLEKFGGGKLVPAAIGAITGSQFTNLERDLSLAMKSGDESAGPALLASRKLRDARLSDPTALIPTDAAVELVRATSNPEAMPLQMTDAIREEITAAILESAKNASGTLSTVPGQAFGPMARLFGAPSESSLATDGSGFSQQIAGAAVSAKLDDIKTAMERQAAALERQNALVEQQNALLEETADNTAPRTPDFDATLNASMTEQDAR